MSQKFKAHVLPNAAPVSNGNSAAMETSIRQLLANGNSKAALESAKQFHKTEHSLASEVLLLEAYKARIQTLLDQNLASEAKALIQLVQERFPARKEQLTDIGAVASARSGELSDLVQPLNDPELSAERRAAIEQILQTQLADLQALADCQALPAEHSLRQAAAALERAFQAVTSGPVSDEQIALPEVSHRSPLASWKWLIRAIAALYRGEDAACRESLTFIKAESVPARLGPAMQAILGAVTDIAALKPHERTLVSTVSLNLLDLRGALQQLDEAFIRDEDERIFKAVRNAVRECQRSAPDRLPLLKQIIDVRGGESGLDGARLIASMEGAPRRDAAYFRMYARQLETAGGDPEDLAEACEMWEAFRKAAISEGLFTGHSVELAVLYLHMAGNLAQMPAKMLREFQRDGNLNTWATDRSQGDDRYYLHPEKLYARACLIDRDSEAFSQWLNWAKGQTITEAENVAKQWHKARPGDIEPLLHLMKQAEKRNAFPSALAYLEKAERIDAVDSVVRAARWRLLTAAALRHLQQKKPHLALQKLTEMAALPQSQQGNRPGFLAAFRVLICSSLADKDAANEASREAERLLGGLTAILLIFTIATTAKRDELAAVPPPKALKDKDREAIPAAFASVLTIAKDAGIKKIGLASEYFDETQKQLPRAAGKLDLEQLRALGEIGGWAGYPKIAWAASTEGLKRPNAPEAFFLMVRARALKAEFDDRKIVLAAAAVELARFQGDAEALNKAVEFLREFSGDDTPTLTLTLEQARAVVVKESAYPDLPGFFTPVPDYSDLFPADALCQCANCRRKRGESASGPFEDIPDSFDFAEGDEDANEDQDLFPDFGFDESEMRKMFKQGLPKGTPPEMANKLFEIMKQSILTGESPEKLLAELLGPPDRGAKKQKKKLWGKK